MMRALHWLTMAGVVLVLSACASSNRPTPAPTPKGTNTVGVQAAWRVSLGGGAQGLMPSEAKGRVAVASRAGQVMVLNGRDGAKVWQAQAPAAIDAGLGYDGQWVAVVLLGNQLTAWREGKMLWQAPLPARVFTPPLVAGERVFVLTGDRQVMAFDASNGGLIWEQKAPAATLALESPGLLVARGNTLLVGLGAALWAINPDNGQPLSSVVLFTPTGSNPVEQLADLVAGAHQASGTVCARAFQRGVACVDVATSQVRWRANQGGAQGLAGTANEIFATDDQGTVQAWSLADGQTKWRQTLLQHRNVTGPLALGQTLVVGDGQGYVHWLSQADGAWQATMAGDGSAVTVPPLLAGGSVITVSANGQVTGWRPQ